MKLSILQKKISTWCSKTIIIVNWQKIEFTAVGILKTEKAKKMGRVRRKKYYFLRNNDSIESLPCDLIKLSCLTCKLIGVVDILISFVQPKSQMLLTIWMRCVQMLPWDFQGSQHYGKYINKCSLWLKK